MQVLVEVMTPRFADAYVQRKRCAMKGEVQAESRGPPNNTANRVNAARNSVVSNAVKIDKRRKPCLHLEFKVCLVIFVLSTSALLTSKGNVDSLATHSSFKYM